MRARRPRWIAAAIVALALLLEPACTAVPASTAAPTAMATASRLQGDAAPSPLPARVPSTPTPTLTLTPYSISPSQTVPPVVSLVAVGDVMLARQLGQRLAAGDIEYPFALVAGTLRAADITLANLECAVGDQGQPLAKSYRFQAPPSAAESLAWASFDLVTLANNHAMDFGRLGLEDTLLHLQAAGVAHVGAGSNSAAARAPAVLERNGLRVAFLGYVDVPVERSGWDARSVIASETTPGLAWADPTEVAADVAAARQQADVVIVLVHSGHEYRDRPNAIQIAIGHAAVDAGAAAVIMAHSHTLQGVEQYHGGLIAYSLGNFAFQIDQSRDSAMLRLRLTPQGVERYEWLPVVLDPNDGRPAPAQGAAWELIMERVTWLSRELE